MLIVLEGIDGSGKSSIAQLLKEELEKRKYKIWLTKEPTKGPIGRLIREFLAKGHKLNENWGRVMALLFAADRYYHQEEIKEKIRQGYIIISDRYYHSTFAYQPNYPGTTIEWIRELHRYLEKPDYVFILDIPVELAIERMSDRKKRHMYEKKEFLEKVRYNYLRLKEILPNENIIYISNDRLPEETVKEILKILKL
ncbi:MAG TPA: dTMP kinase [Candidatus Nanopusillus sp.]|nr:dTMP kinase [Candidatus Nanopusillus sp.]